MLLLRYVNTVEPLVATSSRKRPPLLSDQFANIPKVSQLRTVPTKYQGFCAKLGPRGKSRSLKGLLESTKKNWGSHAFFRDN